MLKARLHHHAGRYLVLFAMLWNRYRARCLEAPPPHAKVSQPGARPTTADDPDPLRWRKRYLAACRELEMHLIEREAIEIFGSQLIGRSRIMRHRGQKHSTCV